MLSTPPNIEAVPCLGLRNAGYERGQILRGATFERGKVRIDKRSNFGIAVLLAPVYPLPKIRRISSRENMNLHF